MLTPSEIKLYLARIGITSVEKPDLNFLCSLQYAHLMHIPYETFDIVNGVPINLSVSALFQKIVLNHRGGYCFELNELFYQLLSSVGYNAERHFARYLRGESGVPMRRHQVLTVSLSEGEFICDVGVGADIPLFPIKVSDDLQMQERGIWFCRQDAILGTVLCQKNSETYEDVFSFTREATFPIDFSAVHYFCQYSPESVFRQKLMCAIRTATGKISISGNELHFYENGQCRVVIPKDQTELMHYVKDYFGIVL